MSQDTSKQASLSEEFVAFISHSSKDTEKAQQIAASLEKKGLKCWIAPRNLRAGRDYAEEIVHGIRDSRCLVLLLSEAANQSVHVKNEVERAVSYGKAVFPIRIEEVLPSPALELSVSSVHWISAWQGSLSDHIEDLANSIKSPDMRGSSQALRTIPLNKQIYRFVKNNLLSLMIVVLLLVGGIYAYQFIKPFNPYDPNETLPLNSLEKQDLTMIGSASKPSSSSGSDAVSYNLSFIQNSAKASIPTNQVQYKITLDNGQSFTKAGVGGFANFNFVAVEKVNELELLLLDADAKEYGPFEFSLAQVNAELQQSIETSSRVDNIKHLNRWKEQVNKQNLFTQCRSTFAPGFSVCDINSPIVAGKFNEVIEKIELGPSRKTLDYKIDTVDHSNNKGVGTYVNKAGAPSYTFPFPAVALHYRVTFMDGSKSEVVSHELSPNFDRKYAQRVFKFSSNNAEAPPLYALLSIGNERWDPQKDYLSGIMLVPLVSEQVSAINYRVSTQEPAELEEQSFSQMLYWFEETNVQLFGDIGSKVKLLVVYRFRDGSTQEVWYQPDWQEWQLSINTTD